MGMPLHDTAAGGAIRTLALFSPFFYYGIHSLMFGGYPPTAIGYPPTAIGYPPTAIGYPPTAIGYPPTAIGYPPTAIGYPPTAIGYPPTAIGYPPTAIGYPPTAIGYPPAAIVARIGHSEFFFFPSLRHPLHRNVRVANDGVCEMHCVACGSPVQQTGGGRCQPTFTPASLCQL